MKTTKTVLLILVTLLIGNCTTKLPDISSDTATVAPQVIYTLTPSIEPSKTTTPTYIPIDTPTLTPTLTWTPLPTLSAYERDAKIQELLKSNGGCELPCWWGIKPGKTSWPEALHFLTPIIIEIGQGEISYNTENGIRHFSTNFGIYYEIDGVSKQGRILFSVTDNIINGIVVFPPGTQYKYQLHQLLSTLGIPRQVYINAQSSAPISELPPSVLILDYSHVGIWASYGFLPFLDGENLSICPQNFGNKKSVYDNGGNLIGGRLDLFDLTTKHTWAYSSIEKYADIVVGYKVRKLDDVTNMTTEIFYNTFIDPNPTVCLETPANLWP